MSVHFDRKKSEAWRKERDRSAREGSKPSTRHDLEPMRLSDWDKYSGRKITTLAPCFIRKACA